MKFTFSFLAVTIAFFFTGCSNEKLNETTLSGSFKNTTESYLLFSKLESVSSKKFSLIDTLFIDKNGQFEYEFHEEPGIYQLTGTDGKKVNLAINLKEHISISKDDNGFDVLGSPDTQKLQQYESFRKESLNRLVSSVRREIKDLNKESAIEELIIKKRAEEVSNYGIHLNELADFAKNNLQNSLALIPGSLRWNTENLKIYTELTNSFKEKYGGILASKLLDEKINLLQKTAVGAKFPIIEMNDFDGALIQLKSAKSKLTLIDFWASWCPPCRVESKLLNEIYANHSRSDFNIYGISLDTNRERWEAALTLDQRVWDNVSELQGLKTPIAIDLGITALPFNFLIDQKGKIIASNIHGEALKKFIEDYLANAKSL